MKYTFVIFNPQFKHHRVYPLFFLLKEPLESYFCMSHIYAFSLEPHKQITLESNTDYCWLMLEVDTKIKFLKQVLQKTRCQPRILFAFWAASTCCWCMSRFFAHQIVQVLLHRAAVNPFTANLYWYWGLPWLRCRTLLNFMRFTWACSSSLWGYLWMAPLLSVIINCAAQLDVTCKLAERTFSPTGYVTDEDIK